MLAHSLARSALAHSLARSALAHSLTPRSSRDLNTIAVIPTTMEDPNEEKADLKRT